MLVGCFLQTLMALTTFLNQIRIVTTKSPMEVWSYGFFQSPEPWFSYMVYHITELTTLATSLTIYGTFCLKYQVVTDKEVKKLGIVKSFVRFYFPFLLSTIFVIMIVRNRLSDMETQEQLRIINVIFNHGADFTTISYVKFNKLPIILNLIIFIGCFFWVPILSLYNRKKILRQINHRTENMSETRQVLHRNFVMGLTVQCLLPYAFYIPLYIFYYYSVLTAKEFLSVEFFMTLLPQISSLVNPLVSMYFVTPYREKLWLWVKRERKEIRPTAGMTT